MSPLLQDELASSVRDEVIADLVSKIETQLERAELTRAELRGLMGYVEILQAIAAHCGSGSLKKARVGEWATRILEVFDDDKAHATDFVRQWRVNIVESLVRLKNFASR